MTREMRSPTRSSPSCSAVERLEQHADTLAGRADGHRTPHRGHADPAAASPRTAACSSTRTACSPGRSRTSARSRRPPNGWSTTSRSSTSNSARSATTCRRDYYRELPKLADGHLAGYPRVLGLAWAYIAHTDSRFDPDSLRRMVRAYQEVEPLTIGELWAIAISLRILLVENLRRLAEQIVASRDDRQTADDLADGLLGLGGDSLDVAAAALRRLDKATLSTAARVQLFQRLRDQDPAVTPALRWLEETARRSRAPRAEEMVRLEHQRQAAMNVTVRNVITSMRLISWFDWADFVESVGLVDEVLRGRSRVRARWTSPPATAIARPSRRWPAVRTMIADRDRPHALPTWPTPPLWRRVSRAWRSAVATPATS